MTVRSQQCIFVFWHRANYITVFDAIALGW